MGDVVAIIMMLLTIIVLVQRIQNEARDGL
jgi:hypothetical protein